MLGDTFMNYQRIYDCLIERAKNRTPIRYTEKHHITPDFMFINRRRKGPKGHLEGNPDSANNIVRLYPREHFVAHLLLAKIHRNTRYGYQAQSALMFFARVISKHPRQQNYRISSYEYELARKIGLEGISKARKGTMPCVDVKTGESVGSHPTNHPNVLSGKWVHHSKGNVTIRHIETSNKIKVKTAIARKMVEGGEYEYTCGPQDGENNGNYKELTPELKEYIFDCVELSLVNGHLILGWLIANVNKNISKFGIKKISIVFLKSKFGTTQELVDQFNLHRNKNIKFSQYYRGYNKSND